MYIYDFQAKFEAKLLAKHATEVRTMKSVLLEAHTYADKNTNSKNLVSVELLNSETLHQPDSNRIYFKIGIDCFSMHFDQFQGEIEKTMGCNCGNIADKESMESCISHIATYYSYLVDYIVQERDIVVPSPIRQELGIEIPQHETPFFADDSQLGSFEYE